MPQRSHRAGNRRTSHCRIFLADDDADLLCVAGEIIADAGYRPVLFDGAQKLLASLDRTMPAAIITDMAMPGMSGSDLLAILRRSERWRHIPVVVMTGNNDTALPVRLDVPVIYKPDLSGLIPVMATVLCQARQERAPTRRRALSAGELLASFRRVETAPAASRIRVVSER